MHKTNHGRAGGALLAAAAVLGWAAVAAAQPLAPPPAAAPVGTAPTTTRDVGLRVYSSSAPSPKVIAFEVQNLGPAIAGPYAVELDVSFPSGVTVTSVTPNGFSCAPTSLSGGGTIKCKESAPAGTPMWITGSVLSNQVFYLLRPLAAQHVCATVRVTTGAPARPVPLNEPLENNTICWR